MQIGDKVNVPRTGGGETQGLPMNQGLSHYQRMEMYNQGMTDKEMADRLGCRRETLCAWRKKNNLPINKAESWGGCPMEEALTPAQCNEMRAFLACLVRATSNRSGIKLDVGAFCHEYRNLNSRGMIKCQYAEAVELR